MKLIKEFIKGLSYYRKAIRFSSEHGMWKYYIVPALINLLVLSGVVWAAWTYTADLSFFFNEWFGIGDADTWWQIALEYTVLIVIRLLTAFIFFKIYKYIVLILLSPALSFIAGKVQDELHGSELPFTWEQFWKDIWRGLGVAFRSFFMEMFLLVILTLLSFVAVLAPLTSVALILVEWYFLGLSMADYRHEYKRLSPKESLQVSRKHKGLLFGIGAGMHACMFVPVIGIIFAPMLSVVASGIAFFEAEDAPLISAQANSL